MDRILLCLYLKYQRFVIYSRRDLYHQICVGKDHLDERVIRTGIVVAKTMNMTVKHPIMALDMTAMVKITEATIMGAAKRRTNPTIT